MCRFPLAGMADPQCGLLVSVLLVVVAAIHGSSALPPPPPLAAVEDPKEPTCDELRAMWRFSKRQSRAAQMSNEIPTYRDPFAYPLWDPRPASTGLAVPSQNNPRMGSLRNGRFIYGTFSKQSRYVA